MQNQHTLWHCWDGTALAILWAKKAWFSNLCDGYDNDWGFEQCGLMEWLPAHGRGVGLSTRSLSNWAILPFYDPVSDWCRWHLPCRPILPTPYHAKVSTPLYSVNCWVAQSQKYWKFGKSAKCFGVFETVRCQIPFGKGQRWQGQHWSFPLQLVSSESVVLLKQSPER